MLSRVLLLVGAVNGAVVVGLGAYGAHALADASAGRFHTALLYHMFHTLGIVAIGAVAATRTRTRLLAAAGALMLLGIVLFCGSLYAAAIGGYGRLTGLAPFGGASFIVAWVLFAAGAWRR
jgi:uncharacterized membrane protein YgdD (TMEM256/DUF423 family)